MRKREQFQIYIAAYLVARKGEKVLLSQRANTGYQDGKYSLVAGHFDGNETAKQCIIREAKEEANITLSPDDLTVAHVMHRRSSDREYIDVYLVAEKWTGEIKNMEPKKCSELCFYTIKELPKDLLPEIRFAIENIEKKIPYSEIGW